MKNVIEVSYPIKISAFQLFSRRSLGSIPFFSKSLPCNYTNTVNLL